MMIRHLLIRGFKSITELEISPKRVNIFIGGPNSGKSNILEALTWFSVNALEPSTFPELFRFKSATDFFYDSDPSNPISIESDVAKLGLRYARSSNGSIMNHFEGILYKGSFMGDALQSKDWQSLQNKVGQSQFRLYFDGRIESLAHWESPFRTYQFKALKSFQGSFRPYLNPPFGENIPTLLTSNRQLLQLVRSVLKSTGFRPMLKPAENDFSIAKEVKDELYAYPYRLISETLQRIIFYLLAIETNKDSILVLDEPDSNTYPVYTAQLAELISEDITNQYFIATHNPYLLQSLVAKTPMDDIHVYVTRMVEYATTVNVIQGARLSELLDKGMDFFFNLEALAGSSHE